MTSPIFGEQIGSGQLHSGHMASGFVSALGGALVSGQVSSGYIGNAAVVSGSIASGQISSGHLASGLIFNLTVGATLLSGQVASGYLGDNSVVSGSIASGQIASQHLASGLLSSLALTSGQITSGFIGDAALVSGRIGSGAIVGFGKSGFISNTTGRGIASGSVGGFDIADLAIASSHLERGQVGREHMSSGARVWGIQYEFQCGDLISGLKAVAFSMSGGLLAPIIVLAERQSGARLPAIGVTVSGAVSGQFATVVVRGFVDAGVSGMIASGQTRSLYVGSGGLIVNQSGFCGGASSGAPFLSGSAVQYLGQYVSGNVMYVNPEPYPRSGLITAAGQGAF